jgi:hypothetical protein
MRFIDDPQKRSVSTEPVKALPAAPNLFSFEIAVSWRDYTPTHWERPKKKNRAMLAMIFIGRRVRELADYILGGKTQPVVARLIEAGKLTLEDVEEARKSLRKLAKKEKS